MVIDLDDIWKNKCTGTPNSDSWETLRNLVLRKGFKQSYIDETYMMNRLRKHWRRYRYRTQRRAIMERRALFTMLFGSLRNSFVFLLKYLFGSMDVELNAPLMTTCYQFVVLVGVISILVQLQEIVGFLPLQYDTSYFMKNLLFLRKVFSLSILHCLIIAAYNATDRHMNISSSLIGYAMFCMANIALTCFYFREQTSPKTLPCLGIVMIFLLGISQTKALGTVSVLCVAYGTVGSYYIILFKIFRTRFSHLNGRGLSNNLLHVYSNTGVLLIPIIFVVSEVSVIMQHPLLFHLTFWMVMIMPVILQFTLLRLRPYARLPLYFCQDHTPMTILIQASLAAFFMRKQRGPFGGLQIYLFWLRPVSFGENIHKIW